MAPIMLRMPIPITKLHTSVDPRIYTVQIKQSLIPTGLFSDTVPCHLASGLGAGFFAVCIGSPVDVVKSRMMGKFL